MFTANFPQDEDFRNGQLFLIINMSDVRLTSQDNILFQTNRIGSVMTKVSNNNFIQLSQILVTDNF